MFSLCTENQLDALFILNLFRHSTPISFGLVLPIIRRYSLYMYSNWYVLYVRLTGSWPALTHVNQAVVFVEGSH
jgi:hypothetical protein